VTDVTERAARIRQGPGLAIVRRASKGRADPNPRVEQGSQEDTVPVYKVYLCDVLDAVGSARRKDVRSHLQDYFNPIAQGGGFPEGALVDYITATPQPASNELLIYFMPFGWSVANQMPGSTFVNPVGGHDGLTKFSTGGEAVSEVYANSTDTRVLANLAFHEAMHNKLRLGNDMHHQKGLASAAVDNAMRPTEDNQKRMKAALKIDRPQWVGGVSLMLAKARYKGSDPAWDLTFP
jgi:hypothetical protein